MTKTIWHKIARKYIKAGQFPFPVTETMITILQTLLTEKQAEFIQFFRKPSYNITQLKKKTEIPEKELKAMLEELSDLGAITAIPSRSTGIIVYRLPPFFPGLLEFTLMKGTSTEKDKKFAQLWQNYFEEIVDTFQDGFDTIIPLLEKQNISIDHIIPVNEEIEVGEEVSYSMDELSDLIDNQETIALATCYCRHRKDLLNDPCKKTDERKNCFGFGRAAEFLSAHGFAEEISKEKAMKILKQCEKDGLVHKAFHSALDPSREVDGLCNCCECCCGTFDNHYAGGIPLMSLSSYVAIVKDEDCVGCGKCIEECNAKAIELVDMIAQINKDRCLGCGLCALHCPESAIKLEKIESRRVFVPPPKIESS